MTGTIRFVAGCLCLLMFTPALGQKGNRNDKQDEKRENQRVAEAQRQVRDKQDDASTAEKKLRNLLRMNAQLNTDIAQARSQWRQAREDVADQLAKSLGIDAAQTRLKEAKAALANFSQPLLDKLHHSEAWLKSKQAADAAKQRAEQVREDLELSDQDRHAKLDELIEVISQPSELDKQAVLTLPEGQKLNQEVTQALAAIAKIREAIPDEKVDTHPTVARAKQAVERSEKELKQHLQQITTQRGHLQRAQQELLQSRQKLQQAQAADAKDKNRK